MFGFLHLWAVSLGENSYLAFLTYIILMSCIIIIMIILHNLPRISCVDYAKQSCVENNFQNYILLQKMHFISMYFK